MPERAQQALAEHKQILAACRRGDADAAGRAVRLNVAQTKKAISESGGPEDREPH